MTALPTDTVHIANNRYQEAVRVTEAFRVQLFKRRGYSDAIGSPEAASRVEEAVMQHEAAERAEYAAWQELEHERGKWMHRD